MKRKNRKNKYLIVSATAFASGFIFSGLAFSVSGPILNTACLLVGLVSAFVSLLFFIFAVKE